MCFIPADLWEERSAEEVVFIQHSFKKVVQSE